MKNVLKWVVSLAFLTTIFITGCSMKSANQANGSPQQNSLSTNKKTIYSTSSRKNSTLNNPDNQKNGQIISFSKINVTQNDPTLESYLMIYWSEGMKAVAYVSVPKQKGTYPLYVRLHGGYTWSHPLKHVTTITVNHVTYHYDQSIVQNGMHGAITLLPMYQGYDKSQGTVNGLNGDTIDTQNAINALIAFLNSNQETSKIEKNSLYLEGVSMGGGVALKVASERQDVRFVIATSPFVGWDIVGAWDTLHHPVAYLNMTMQYGLYNPQSKVYEEQSIDYQKINAPVLLLQGTADNSVSWQTVEQLYNNMKADHQIVFLKLLKNGNHGLTNKQVALNPIIKNWFNHYWQG